jgi:hypothetical protein
VISWFQIFLSNGSPCTATHRRQLVLGPEREDHLSRRRERRRPQRGAALTPGRGCQIGYTCDHNSTYGLHSLPGGCQIGYTCDHNSTYGLHSFPGVSDWLHVRPKLDLWVALTPGGCLVTEASWSPAAMRRASHPVTGVALTPGGCVRLVTWTLPALPAVPAVIN